MIRSGWSINGGHFLVTRSADDTKILFGTEKLKGLRGDFYCCENTTNSGSNCSLKAFAKFF